MDRFIESVEARRHFTVVTVTGTASADTIFVDIVGSAVNVTLNGSTTPYTGVTGIVINGGNGADHIEFIGGDFTRPATISGNGGNDTIISGAGADQITGNDGDDDIYGMAGNDTINGNDGEDYIEGGSGTDYLFGAAGLDYIYSQDGELDYVYPNDASGTSDGFVDLLTRDIGLDVVTPG